MDKKKRDIQGVINIVVLFVLVAITASQFMLMNSINAGTSIAATGAGLEALSCVSPPADSPAPTQNQVSLLPTGTPETYGTELGVSFDSVESSLTTLDNLDRSIDFDSMASAQQQQYIALGTGISCEFCCTAPYVTTPAGEAACGCSHSYALRGLAKYLTINHPEMSEEQIMQELIDWKTVFFPADMVARLSGGGATQPLPQMVGGC